MNKILKNKYGFFISYASSTDCVTLKHGFVLLKKVHLEQRCPTHSPLATCGEWPFNLI